VAEKKRVRHAAANKEHIGFLNQGFEDCQLSGDLGASKNRGEWTFGIVPHLGKITYFFFNEPAYKRGENFCRA